MSQKKPPTSIHGLFAECFFVLLGFLSPKENTLTIYIPFTSTFLKGIFETFILEFFSFREWQNYTWNWKEMKKVLEVLKKSYYI